MEKKRAEELLNKILSYMNVNVSLKTEELDNGSLEISIFGDDLNFLIGYRGESLEALQTLLNLMLFKETGSWSFVSVDINNYKRDRYSKIEGIAKNYIDRVRFANKEVELPIMSAFERKHVHLFISGYDDIKSESVGEGSQRRVVLKPS